MKPIGRYDGALEMFVQEGQAPDESTLRFLRWLAERGKLEHDIAGPPSGNLVTPPSSPEAPSGS